MQWWVRIGQKEEQRILLELDFELCPRACENFWQLSLGYRDLSYRDSQIHRVVKNGFLEGGLIQGQNMSIYGGFFHDENYGYSHHSAGVLGMSNAGRHKNGSVFYLTLRGLPHLNGRSIAFGRVVEGLGVLREIESLKTSCQRPVEAVSIVRCEDYLELLLPKESERSQGEHVHSKLEGASMEKLLERRQAILKEIQSTQDELDEQKRFRGVLSEIISDGRA